MSQSAHIDGPLAGLRLTQAVAALFGLSRKEAKLAVACGRVTLGRSVCRIQARIVRAGQRLCLADEAPAAVADARTDAGLSLMHVARHYVVIFKPAGLLSERDRFGAPSVESLVPELLAAQGLPAELSLVHRLDAGTSGVMVLARTHAGARRLFEAFRERRVRKRYCALVAAAELPAGKGPVAPAEAALRRSFWQDGRAVVQAPLRRERGTRQAVARAGANDAKAAETRIGCLGTSAHGRLLSLQPITGRSHQLRVHLAHLGAPILGDALYGGARYLEVEGGRAVPVPRTMLHAESLAFVEPLHGDQAPVEKLFRAPLPADFRAVAMALGLPTRVEAPPWPTPDARS